MGRFPSGQREQTVNLPAPPSMVRIHPCPPKQKLPFAGSFCFDILLDSLRTARNRTAAPWAASREWLRPQAKANFSLPTSQRVRIVRTPLLQKEVSKPFAFPINKEKSSNPKNFCLQGLHFSFIDAIIYNCHRQSGAIMRPATISLAHPRRAHPEAHDSGHDTGATQNRWGISTVGRTNYPYCIPVS